MRNLRGNKVLVLAGSVLLSACSSDTGTGTFQPQPGATGGATTTNPYGTVPAQGGGAIGVGGAVVSQGGGAVLPQGGAAVGVGGGAVVSQGGGAGVSQGGGAVVSQGGSTGGTKATTGGAATTGGTKATGGTTGAPVGGTSATGGATSTGTSTAAKNLFTVGPYTGAGWVAGGTVDGTSTGTRLTTFTNPTISGTTQTFASQGSLCTTASIPALQACSAAGVTCSATEKASATGKNYSENWGGMLALNTTATEGTPKGTTFSNIAVSYTGTITPASTQVRLQLELKDGSTYCVNGYASGLQVAVKDFIKNCYDAASTTALTTADTANITSIQLSVASSAVAETISNLCMTDIKLDGSTGPSTTTTCTDTATAANTLTGKTAYATIPTTSAGKSYILQSNWWTSYNNQSEAYSGLSFTVNGSGSFVSATNPLGYPSLFIGAYGQQTSAGSNLPKQVSSLTTIPTNFQWSGSSDISRFNASYDVWFTASNAKLTTQGDPGSGGAYLMVWMFKPSDQTPRGTVVNASVTIPGAPGTWAVWYDPSSGVAPCVSYVANTKLSSITFDLNEFIKNAVTNSWGVKNSQYLSIIFGGFEIWEGHSGLKLDKFCAQVN